MEVTSKARQIEARNMSLLMAKVDTRATVCEGCGNAVYHVYDESHSKQYFTVCGCGVVPRAWDY